MYDISGFGKAVFPSLPGERIMSIVLGRTMLYMCIECHT